MAADRNDLEALARQAFSQLWARGSVGAVERFFAPSEAARALRQTAAVRTGFPDYATTIDSVTVTDETAVVRWTFRGTHLGQFAGLEPTARPVTVQCISIYTFRGSIVAQRLSLWDMLGLLDQLAGITGPA